LVCTCEDGAWFTTCVTIDCATVDPAGHVPLCEAPCVAQGSNPQSLACRSQPPECGW
jgi:hypothetical protein